MRTTTVSVIVPIVLASVSRIVPLSAPYGSIVVGNVPDEEVSGQTTRIRPDVTESVAVCVSA